MKKVLILSVAAAVSLLIWPDSSTACSLAPQTEHTMVDEAAPDDVPPPDKPQLSLVFLHRGEASGPRESDTCDDTGFFRFKIEPDNPEMGYIFNVRSGTLPEGYEFPDEPVRSNLGGPYWTDWWTDGATNDQEAFRFELEVVAIDKWGRKSDPSNTLVVEDPGSGSSGPGNGGCASTRATPKKHSIFIAFALFAFVYRRKMVPWAADEQDDHPS